MVVPVGNANGVMTVAEVLADAARGGAVAAQAAGFAAEAVAAKAQSVAEAAMEAVWVMPQGASPKLRAKMWLDYQNDVKVSDVQLAARVPSANRTVWLTHWPPK